MTHKWMDGDIERVCIGANISESYIDIHTEEEVDQLHLSIRDVEYIYYMLTSAKMEQVSQSCVTTQLTRDDIIMLAKTAGLTEEDLK